MIITDNDCSTGDRAYVRKFVITKAMVFCPTHHAYHASASCYCNKYWKGNHFELIIFKDIYLAYFY